MYTTIISSPLGNMELQGTENALIKICFTDNPLSSPKIQLLQYFTQYIQQFDEYFSGSRKVFTLPYELQGTDFQKKVRGSLLDIPYRTTLTYAQQAKNSEILR